MTPLFQQCKITSWNTNETISEEKLTAAAPAAAAPPTADNTALEIELLFVGA